MRIISGKHKGRNIAAPRGLEIRPTSDRVREAVFNSLEHSNWEKGGLSVFKETRVLDAFCGTGACGLEALSRGAGHVTFIDNNNAAVSQCKHNIRSLKEEGRTEILKADCLSPPRPIEPNALVFIDPPYGRNLAGTTLRKLLERGWIMKNAICVIETGTNERVDISNEFALLDDRKYGVSRIRIFSCTIGN